MNSIAALEIGRDGVLVAAGELAVDKVRALDVLRRYQLPDPYGFLLPWLRLAAASGAGQVRINSVLGGLELGFDGDPLDRDSLSDPCACFFHDEPHGGERRRHLAVGMLAALRLEPRSLTVASGTESRWRLTIEGLKRETITPDLEPVAGTVMRLTWGGWFRWRRTQRCLDMAKAACRLYPVPLRINNRPAPGPPMGFPSTFEHADFRGWFGPAEPADAESRIALYKLGVYVETLRLTLPGRQVLAQINGDRLNLNLSHSGVVRDAELRRLLDLLTARMEAGA